MRRVARASVTYSSTSGGWPGSPRRWLNHARIIASCDFGACQVATIDDPKAYTKPWTVRVNQRLLVDTDLIEFVCLENERFSSRFRN